MSISKSIAALPKSYWEGLKDRLKSRRTYIVAGLMLLSAVFTLIGLILYRSIEGTSSYLMGISKEAVAFYIVGIVLSVVVVFVPFKICYVLDALILLSAPLLFLTSQASFIANVFIAIDGQSFSAAFILGAVFPLVAVGLTAAATFLLQEPAFVSVKKSETPAPANDAAEVPPQETEEENHDGEEQV